jgi:hypothetical protein
MSEEALPPTTLARMSAVLCMAPLLGLVLTVWGIVRHFQAISGAAYEGDPGVAQQEVGGYLVYMGVGVVLALVGFPLSLWCIFARKHRPWWLVTAAAFAGFLLVWFVLHGTWIYLHRPTVAA